jgi:hypothetical protein
VHGRPASFGLGARVSAVADTSDILCCISITLVVDGLWHKDVQKKTILRRARPRRKQSRHVYRGYVCRDRSIQCPNYVGLALSIDDWTGGQTWYALRANHGSLRTDSRVLSRRQLGGRETVLTRRRCPVPNIAEIVVRVWIGGLS